MTRRVAVLVLAIAVAAPGLAAEGDDAVRSEVLKTDAGDLILSQEVVVEAPVDRVWEAYTTGRGWMAWAAPVAEVDLRAGGTIRTHYGEDANIGDPGTIVLHIVNYVPRHVLTLRAEASDRWPEVMKEDDGKLMNVIVFDALGETRTRVRSFGVGYRDLPAYDELMQFFIPANEGLLRKLKEHLERAPMDAAAWNDLATRYAAAWSGQDPGALAAFYAEDGVLQVNDGEPAVGRAAIAEKARGFMEAFPDMVVALDSIEADGDRAVFRWRWTGTHTGPGGTGRSVDLRGYEEWTIDADGRIARSLGHYDEAEYRRQIGEQE